jgi:glycerol-3-phosphate dehydrogenase (NAD(P)+)
LHTQITYGILGGGSWATALAKMLTDNGHNINWYIRDKHNIELFQQRGHNPHYVSSIYFDVQKIHFSTSTVEVIEKSTTIIIAIPSAFVLNTLEALPKGICNGKKIISAIKGIIPPQHILLNEYLYAHHHVQPEQYAIVAGPCHAEEVASERLSYLTFAAHNVQDAQMYAKHFATPYIKTVVNADVDGAQYAAVLKNIYAVGAGIAHGLDYGDNFMSVFIAGAADEMAGFLRAVAPTNHTTINYAASVYLGDLLVTCYSLHSRNRRFGNYLGKGYSVQSAQLEMNMVAEGYHASKGIFEKNKTLQANIPIAEAIYKILWQQMNVKQAFKLIENILT